MGASISRYGRKPFFSVILPVYNGENFVSSAVESVLDQSDPDWELIAVDDASRDRSLEILSGYAQHDSRIRILKNEQNRNIAPSLNRGIEAAAGEWMVRLDADDFFDSRYLETLRGAIPDSEMAQGLISTWVRVVDEHDELILEVRLPDENTVRRMMPIENFLYHPATSFSKRAWERAGGYPEPRSSVAEDTALWNKFFKEGLPLKMIPEFLVNYRIHSTNITSVNDAGLHLAREKEKRAARQKSEWVISLLLKQSRLKPARAEIVSLCRKQKKYSLKNLQYLLLTFLPKPLVHFYMWEFRPRARAFSRFFSAKKIRI